MSKTNMYIILGLLAVVVIYLYSRSMSSSASASAPPPEMQNGGSTDPRRLVLYYAPWCGHCQKLKPTWAQLEQEYHGKQLNGQTIKIEQVNCDEQPEVAKSLGIEGYPTIILFDGQDKKTYQGDRSFGDLVEFLK